jgi:putative membrane protein (TIGR04086 family)
MSKVAKIRWGRALIGGFLAEVAVIVLVIPVFFVLGQHAVLYAAPAASFLACLGGGYWVARGAEPRWVLHGILVGLVATLLYVGLTLARPEPTAYIAAHALKILGGAAGGFLAGRRREGANTASAGV